MIIILNGPLGIGKSTLAEALLERIELCAMIEGDSLVAVNPPPVDLNAHLHSAIEQLFRHHRRFGYRHFVVEHLWRSAADLADLRRRLMRIDEREVRCFLLTCRSTRTCGGLNDGSMREPSTSASSSGVRSKKSGRRWHRSRTWVNRSTCQGRRRSSQQECCVTSRSVEQPERRAGRTDLSRRVARDGRSGPGRAHTYLSRVAHPAAHPECSAERDRVRSWR